MADIAVVFHWAPRDMATFELGELLDWREQARVRASSETE